MPDSDDWIELLITALNKLYPLNTHDLKEKLLFIAGQQATFNNKEETRRELYIIYQQVMFTEMQDDQKSSIAEKLNGSNLLWNDCLEMQLCSSSIWTDSSLIG